MPFFPSEIENTSVSAVDYRIELDLNTHLVQNAASTFFAQIAERPGDIIVIDKSMDTCESSLVVVFIDGEFRIRRYSDLLLHRFDTEHIWGVVRYYIQKTF